MAKVEVTDELLKTYQKHPRILEVRFILFFDMLEREYGYAGAKKIISAFCMAFNRNEDMLNVILNKRFDIKRKQKTSKIKWTQEVVFMGMCYGETPYKIAKDYLVISPSNLSKGIKFTSLATKSVLNISVSGPKTTSLVIGLISVTNTGLPRAIPRPFL